MKELYVNKYKPSVFETLAIVVNTTPYLSTRQLKNETFKPFQMNIFSFES